MDVIKAYPDRADGAVRLSRDGFPAVVLDGDGRPGVTVPSSGPFEDLEVETLKQGSGATVEDGDLVVVNFTGVLWDDNTVFDTTWKDEGTSPTVWSVGEGGNIPTGLSDALIGKTVGSQVVVVVPPDQGYGSSGSGEIPADATLVYVVDILGIYGDE
nr:FKBP-type peptidyl-prolyl cis-trans isomerase [Agromyces seonyuensis]